MGRLDRVKEGIFIFIRDNIKKVEETYAQNKIPADYSLGALNTAILIYNKICGHDVFRKYFGRHSNNDFDVGVYPIPVILKAPKQAHAEKEFRRAAHAILKDLADHGAGEYKKTLTYALEMYEESEKNYESVLRPKSEQEEKEKQPAIDEATKE